MRTRQILYSVLYFNVRFSTPFFVHEYERKFVFTDKYNGTVWERREENSYYDRKTHRSITLVQIVKEKGK